MELTMKVSKIKIDYKIVFTCGVCGVILLIVGLYLGFSFLPKFVDKKLLEAKVLKENTEQWKTFMKVPFSLNFKVYLFTIVNHEEVLKGAKPAVKETGPYVYKLNRWKDDVVWNYVSDEISYYDYELYDFDQEASGDLTEDDLITTLNIPYMTFLLNAESNEATAGFLPMIDEALESIFAENNGPFLINATVRDYLFDGIRFCKNGCIDDGFVAKMVCDKMKEKLNVTDQIRLDGNDIVYSTFYYRNNTRQAYITVNSGRKNNQEIGTMTRLNNNSFVKAWLNDKYQCNKVVGATSIFPINLSSKTKFQSFSPEICRSIKFEFGKMELVGLIKGYTYFASKSSFNNSKNVLENHCYCTNKTQNLDGNFGCLYDGVTDITTCQGSPVLVSFPHLLHADLRYVSSVEGLNPDSSKHEMFVTLEPVSGTPLKLAKKIQFNTILRPIEGITSLQSVVHSLVPLFWIEESATLPEKYQQVIVNTLYRTLFIINVIRYTILAVAVAIIACCCLLFFVVK
ncbi:sensory neuron membrane protein 2-like [Euwallacea fornicatus]|uniref:sensory neuron membrane protein 2-like n=1 Tax=Euwallacea fornicatus TaxID=995702 RepID=UPI00338ED3AB